ncbi:restriction endonuclease [Caenimonas soli]|uniref:restriction endonuclease n=1 Tax=Caenimonas soli TaxID=2735555 RepID=UPI001551C6E7|nr:restriction endonuclease [Caenimonas soli]NPC56317.1 restriction endonuclease [Caenimonas soli]
MRTRKTGQVKKDASRKVLAMAISLLGMGVLLLSLSLSLGSSLLAPVPYVFLTGFGLLVLYAVLRPAPDRHSGQRNEPTLFGKDTTVFASRMDGEGEESAFPPHRGERPPATDWSPRVFEDIEWRRFEALCASLFGQAGFETRAQSHGADGGVDIWLYSQHAEGPAAVVQCKHWLGKPVGVKEMREFYGVMASHKLQRGTFAATSTFTEEARRFAKDNGISALDGQGLLALISTRTPAQQESLLAIAYEGEYWRPTCASCGVKMVERSARGKSRPFWGCVHFPGCRFTLPVRAPAV